MCSVSSGLGTEEERQVREQLHLESKPKIKKRNNYGQYDEFQ